MLNHRLRVFITLFVLGAVFVGLASIGSFTYTGKVAHNPAKPPLVAAIFNMETKEVQQDVLYDLLEKEDANIVLKPIVGEDEENSYLFLRWSKDISKLSIYMRKVGEEDSKFEIWGPEDRKIACGELSNDYEWYEFDLEEEMKFEDYALFNYGPSEIKIDKILGDEPPESKSSRLMGIFTRGFM